MSEARSFYTTAAALFSKADKNKQIVEKFNLTEEQLVQIAIAENIAIKDIERMDVSEDVFRLNENQIRSLIDQIDIINYMWLTSRLHSKQSPLILQLDQLIALCNQQKININELYDKTAVSNSSVSNSHKVKFTLLSSQIAHLIEKNNFDISKLIAIEKSLKEQDIQAQQFRLNASQLAYLFVHQRITQSHKTVGLTASQLIGLYLFQQQSIKNDHQGPSFSLTYQQIKQLASMQNMRLEHLQSLPSSTTPFQLTENQLIHIATENKTSLKQIVLFGSDQKSTPLDREQVCALINQNSSSTMLQKSSHSMDEFYHTQQHIPLNATQIFSIVSASNIELDQLTSCDSQPMKEFRFKPEQLAMLCRLSVSPDNLKHITSVPETSSQFILSDEQFCSLLHSVSTSLPQTHLTSTTNIKSNLELNVRSKISTDTLSTLADQLTAMRQRLQASVQTHTETVKIVSSSMLKRHRIEKTLSLIHQLNIHTIDDISTREEQAIPSFVIDLLKTNTMTENTYESIQQGALASDKLDTSHDLIANGNISTTIIEGIQAHQLNFSQIHKIQTQLLTPKLINEFKSGHLPQRILDAYKSQSPLQVIHKVRSSAIHMNTLLLQQSPMISDPDAMLVSILQQTVTPNTATADNVVSTDHSLHVDFSPEATKEDPIIIYPESAVIRQQILEELGERLDTQLLELKKEYGVEPIKGQTSIRQITNKLRTMSATEDLEHLIGRQIDEVDILNIFQGNIDNLLDQVEKDPHKTTELFDRNTQQRLKRINERIQLVNILQNDIENERLKRPMNLDEYTALVLEDIEQFEQPTGINLTEDDLRIISMNRFAPLERSIARQLTNSEYRSLLKTDLSLNYIEHELLKRPLTADERVEQDELSFFPCQELFPSKLSISYGTIIERLKEQKIKLTHLQLEQILQRRAEIVDQYEIIQSITPSIKRIEDQLNRSLTIDEKKRLAEDDYSMITQIKTPQESPSSTSSLLELLDKKQADIEQSVTKQDITVTANSGKIGRDEMHDKFQSNETIKPSYDDRFTDVTTELNRNLSEKDLYDITSTERSTYKPMDIVDLDGSQSTTNSVMKNKSNRHFSSDDLNIKKKQETDINDSEDDLFLFGRRSKQPIYSTLSDIEKAIGKHLNSDELQRFDQIKYDLGKSLNDSQKSKLLQGETSTIERILTRSLTLDELTNLAGDRFDEICRILQRPLQQHELIDLLNGHYDKITKLIDEELDKRKEIELKELPIHRIRLFQNILRRQLSSDELLRFGKKRFQPLFTNDMKAEQILDLASGHYDKIEIFLIRSLITKEKYELQKNILRAHMKYTNILEELEYIVQRELNEQELKNLMGSRYEEIEKRLGRSLDENQLRNILYGKSDDSLSDIEDLLKHLRRQYEDNNKRTRRIVIQLIEKLDREYQNSLQSTPEQLPEHQSLMIDQDVVSSSQELVSSSMEENKSTKAFENVTRIVKQIADKEHVEEITAVTDFIDRFQENLPQHKKSPSNQTTLTWLSSLNNDPSSSQLPVIEPIDNKPISHVPSRQTDEDLYLGWTLFKTVNRSELGLKEQNPLMINVKHIAHTYVVGIPEEYADEKSKIIAKKIYRGEPILHRVPPSRIIKEMGESVSQLLHIPIINDATHFIVPSRAYSDIIEPVNTYESELIDIEDNELQMRDSPETLEWYEECQQRNIQVHAQIPTGYQPSIIYCHTGRRIVLTPAKRAEQRNTSTFDQQESKVSKNISTFNNDLIVQLHQPRFDIQTTEPTSTARTVTDLIMHTVTMSQKSDLLEALDELFSQENLEKYQMTETHWQDIFLILLNSYLHSHSTNRKVIFKRLIDKLHELRKKERRRSSGLYPSIAIASPAMTETPKLLSELDTTETQRKQFHFGLRSSFDSMNSLNDSEVTGTPLTSNQRSTTSPENIRLLSKNESSTQSVKASIYTQLNIDTDTLSSTEYINESPMDRRQYKSINSNAIIKQQHSSTLGKQRQYRITVIHSDEPFDTSSNRCRITTESTKLPPIASKNRLSQTKRSKSTVFPDDQNLPALTTTTRIPTHRKKITIKK